MVSNFVKIQNKSSCKTYLVNFHTMSLLPAAVLWDMDGTIIDTEPFWLEAEIEVARRAGAVWTLEDALKQVGQGLTDTAKNMQDAGVDLTIEQLVEQMIDYVVEKTQKDQRWRPGAVELLKELRKDGIPTALVTMSYTRLTQVVLDHLGFDAFDVIVTGDIVPHSKPHPAPYLMAAEQLGVDIRECIAFEDSIPGITSAHTSGAVSVAVENHIAIPESDQYTKWSTLDGVTVASLVEFYIQTKGNRDQ